MSRLSVILFLLVTPTLLLAQTCDLEIQALRWIENADPIKDASNAVKSGNTKFMAVYGFTLYIPGIEGKSIKGAYDEDNYIAIEGTGDDLCSEEHVRLNIIASEYAKIYNQQLLGGK